jgi:lysophospholipase L1-like esterase
MIGAMSGDGTVGGPSRTWRTYVALGDSFTEGVGDPDPVTGAERGWADRLASVLAEGEPAFRYANLAVRGMLLDRVLATQVPARSGWTPTW